MRAGARDRASRNLAVNRISSERTAVAGQNDVRGVRLYRRRVGRLRQCECRTEKWWSLTSKTLLHSIGYTSALTRCAQMDDTGKPTTLELPTRSLSASSRSCKFSRRRHRPTLDPPPWGSQRTLQRGPDGVCACPCTTPSAPLCHGSCCSPHTRTRTPTGGSSSLASRRRRAAAVGSWARQFAHSCFFNRYLTL